MGVSFIPSTQSRPAVRNSSGEGPLSNGESAIENDGSVLGRTYQRVHSRLPGRHVTGGLRHGVVSLRPRYPFNIASRCRSSSSSVALQSSPPAIPHWEQRIYLFETGGVPNLCCYAAVNCNWTQWELRQHLHRPTLNSLLAVFDP